MEQKQNLTQMLSLMKEPFRRMVIGQVDNYCAFLVRIEGSYLFHQHHKDEMYLVLEGELAVDYADGTTITLKPWDTLVARAGEKHRSRSDHGAVALIFKAIDILSNEEQIVESRATRPT